MNATTIGSGKKSIRGRGLLQALALAALIAGAGAMSARGAVTAFWHGQGSSANWSDSANWDDDATVDAETYTPINGDTAVFAFSDHGEWAGDYGLVEKWHSGLDDCLTRVPLIVRGPGCRAGQVVNAPVELLDIMPTTLDLAGIKCRHTHFARSLFGEPRDAVFAEGGYDPHEPHCYEGTPGGLEDVTDARGIYYLKGRQQQEHPESSAHCVMIRTAAHKLVHRPGDVSELYDLVHDPLELNNLHGQLPAVQQQLERRLLDWYVHTGDVVPWQRDPRGFPK